MKRAEIFIEDAENAAAIRFVFPGGFDPKSPAHQLASIIQKELDELANTGHLTPVADPDQPANDAQAALPLESPREDTQPTTPGTDSAAPAA